MRVIAALGASGAGCLSAQVLPEFVNASARPRRKLLTTREALEEMVRFARGFEILDLTKQVVFEAARGAREYQLPYFDAQLWATARLNQVGTIFSEDFQHGRT